MKIVLLLFILIAAAAKTISVDSYAFALVWKPDKSIFPQDKNTVLAFNAEKKARMPEPLTKNPLIPVKQKASEIKTIIIDPGHGGKDPGAVSGKPTWNKTKRNIKHIKTILTEKEAVLAISKILAKLLKEKLPEIQCILTRDDDSFIALKDRIRIANQRKGDLFISIHANSIHGDKSKKACINGYGVYFLDVARDDEARAVAALENASITYEENRKEETDNDLDFILKSTELNLFRNQSEAFAIILEQEMGKIGNKFRRHKTGVDQADFYVLRGAEMPAVLLETAFISNPLEAEMLGNGSFQEAVARAVLRSIIRYKEKYEIGLEAQ
ncbi:MAG: N-acetylmuramoyl-L-alanine amidase [Fibrobacterota bacterium]